MGLTPTLPDVSLGVSPTSGFMVYVDNFFAWAPAADFVGMHTRLQDLIAKFGLPLHELQVDGRLFTAPGWIFDASATERWCMVLPEDKFVILMRYLGIWANATILCISLVATRKARGFLLSISKAFMIGKADVAHVTHMQTAGEAMARRLPRVPCEAIMVPKSAEALGAVGFWAEALASWDRKRLCVL